MCSSSACPGCMCAPMQLSNACVSSMRVLGAYVLQCNCVMHVYLQCMSSVHCTPMRLCNACVSSMHVPGAGVPQCLCNACVRPVHVPGACVPQCKCDACLHVQQKVPPVYVLYDACAPPVHVMYSIVVHVLLHVNIADCWMTVRDEWCKFYVTHSLDMLYLIFFLFLLSFWLLCCPRTSAAKHCKNLNKVKFSNPFSGFVESKHSLLPTDMTHHATIVYM